MYDIPIEQVTTTKESAMGDRANALLHTDEGDLYLYTHWAGTELPEMARAAVLAAKPRWSDRDYAMRIVVDQLTKSARDEETGFGLSFGVADDNHGAVVVIDFAGQRLAIAPLGHEKDAATWRDIVKWGDLHVLGSYDWHGASDEEFDPDNM